MIETLEGRRLMAAGSGGAAAEGGKAALAYTVSDAGQLVISNARNVDVADYDWRNPDVPYAGVIFLTDNTTGAEYVIGDDEPAVTSVIVNGTKGSDTFSVSMETDLALTIFAGGGNDTFIVGGSGDGDMALYGEAGRDQFLVSELAMDRPSMTIVGGPGRDTFGFGETPID